MKSGRDSKYLNGKYNEFVSLIYEKYGSIRQFCLVVGVSQANLNSNLEDTYRMSIERMFACANALHIPFYRMVQWFWKDELEDNLSGRYSFFIKDIPVDNN